MHFLKKIALNIHIQYHRLYSYYKVSETGLITSLPLTSSERDFYLGLQTVLKSNSLVVYDIGAAEGIVSSLFAKLPNISEVHAFEPIPNMYRQLTFSVKPFPNVHCHNVALGNEKTEKAMYIASNSDSSSLLQVANLHKDEFNNVNFSKKITVNCVRLDDYVEENQLPLPNIVKIDVQGYEKEVLNGGQITIKKADYCILEMSFYPLYEGSPLFDDIYTQMRELGFQLIGISKPLKGKSGDQLQIDGIFKNSQLSKIG